MLLLLVLLATVQAQLQYTAEIGAITIIGYTGYGYKMSVQ